MLSSANESSQSVPVGLFTAISRILDWCTCHVLLIVVIKSDTTDVCRIEQHEVKHLFVLVHRRWKVGGSGGSSPPLSSPTLTEKQEYANLLWVKKTGVPPTSNCFYGLCG